MRDKAYSAAQQSKLMSTKEGHIYKRWHSRKTHAKEKGIEFTVSLEYVTSIAPDVCPILNIPLSWCVRSKTVTDNSPSIDRIDPSKGYIEGNVVWLSGKANRIKNSGTAEEHLAIYNFMKQFHDVQ